MSTKKTQLYVVVGVFGGVVDTVVVDTDKTAAQAHYRRLCTEYGFDPAHATESEHDVKLVPLSLPLLTPTLSEEEVARLTFKAVERMGDIFYDATRWGEPYTCAACDAEFTPDELRGVKPVDGKMPCPTCGGILTSADERIREAAEGAVEWAIREALQAAGSGVIHDTPSVVARLEALLAHYQAEYTAYTEGREAQEWEGYDSEEAEADGQCQGLIWGLKHVLAFLREGRWEFAQSLAMQGYVEQHADDVADGDVTVPELEE